MHQNCNSHSESVNDFILHTFIFAGRAGVVLALVLNHVRLPEKQCFGFEVRIATLHFRLSLELPTPQWDIIDASN